MLHARRDAWKVAGFKARSGRKLPNVSENFSLRVKYYSFVLYHQRAPKYFSKTAVRGKTYYNQHASVPLENNNNRIIPVAPSGFVYLAPASCQKVLAIAGHYQAKLVVVWSSLEPGAYRLDKIYFVRHKPCSQTNARPSSLHKISPWSGALPYTVRSTCILFSQPGDQTPTKKDTVGLASTKAKIPD